MIIVASKHVENRQGPAVNCHTRLGDDDAGGEASMYYSALLYDVLDPARSNG